MSSKTIGERKKHTDTSKIRRENRKTNKRIVHTENNFKNRNIKR